MSFTNIFNTMKNGNGIIKLIEQQALKEGANEEDSDRKNITNSPSSALGCVRANFYQRLGEEKGVISPRLRRIFDNGHDVHERIQSLAKRAGVLAMDEVPLFNKEMEIQGHTDGIIFLKGGRVEAQVLEIKSINTRGFSLLKDARDDHKAQAQVYIYCLEEHRKQLREKYPTKEDFAESEEERKKEYSKLYGHLKNGAKFTREEKIGFKAQQHLDADSILYKLKKPITETLILYENKDTQEMKEFIVQYDEKFMEEEVLSRFKKANIHWKKKIIPRRECENKNQGKWCPYVDTCFPS